MSILDIFKKNDINRGVEDFRNTPGAVLIDVRSAEEFAGGHIPGSINLPIQALRFAPDHLGDPQAPLFLYCHSGARSRQATSFLQYMGYTNVHNIGGITAYSGKVESL